jgi:hypothetical protein
MYIGNYRLAPVKTLLRGCVNKFKLRVRGLHTYMYYGKIKALYVHLKCQKTLHHIEKLNLHCVQFFGENE